MKLPIAPPEKMKLWQYWVETVQEEALDELSQWEFNFIFGIAHTLEDNITLSKKQAQVLENIYVKYTK